MKQEKTISLAESSELSINKLISEVLNKGQISDVEFYLILCGVQQSHSLKKGQRSEAS